MKLEDGSGVGDPEPECRWVCLLVIAPFDADQLNHMLCSRRPLRSAHGVLNSRDIKCLAPKEWANDEIVAFSVK
jgi:hypothetical protein